MNVLSVGMVLKDNIANYNKALYNKEENKANKIHQLIMNKLLGFEKEGLHWNIKYSFFNEIEEVSLSGKDFSIKASKNFNSWDDKVQKYNLEVKEL